ncbi:MAG: DEAD/DEAH box helicase [Propionibacteriaceae bacterium]
MASWLRRLDEGQISHVKVLPARQPTYGDWPHWLPRTVRQALADRGLERPWVHQVAAADAAFRGQHVVVSTGTASGKTLAYLLPVLAATHGGLDAVVSQPVLDASTRARAELRAQLMRPRRPHTALYLSPTKALAHDQLRVADELAIPSWRVATVDGDSDRGERDWARQHAAYMLTNPDLLHRSLLPNHARWSGFLSTLRYVVVDESHRYRGVFGSHVAAVLRRLRRICASYGAAPTFVLATATSSNAAEAAAELIGAERTDVVAVSDDASPHGRVSITLWDPDGAGRRSPAPIGPASTDRDAARLLAASVDAGRQTVAFIPSRRMAEQVAIWAQNRLGRHLTDVPDTPGSSAEVARAGGPRVEGPRVEAYRSGYLAADRRSVEARLQDGRLAGVAATNALELGVDIAGLDTVVIAGFPGTRAALWQQAGRAGRAGRDADVVLVCRRDPLDAYLFGHPQLLLDAPVEATVLHAANPYVLGPHLAAAAQELPITVEDQRWFGPTTRGLLDQLVAQGALRRRSSGWWWTRDDRAVDAVDLRSSGGGSVDITEVGTGRVLGQVDPVHADGALHTGAVYLHQGDTYLVDELNRDEHEALVRRARPGYTTQPQGTHDLGILRTHRSRVFGIGRLSFGDVEVRSRVHAYLRRDEVTGEVVDEHPLESPERVLRTAAVWWTVDPSAYGVPLNPIQLAGASHGAEHCAIGLLPLFAPCDRWDIGGLSTVLHPDTGLLSVFVHDGHPGGAGFAERGYDVAEQWWAATREQLDSCACPDGCPSCVVSPKCGNGNQLLDKRAASVLLHALLR